MKKLLLIILCIVVASTDIIAQQNKTDDPIGHDFFSPDLVMQNQKAINLTETQRNTISKEMQNAQTEFMALQWDLQKETEKFKSLVEKETLTETQVLDQMERLLTIENKIKKRQISLMVRIKNLLSHEQQEKLRKLK
jgi:Spy/CpxP family protein refolding chaperone